MCCCLFPVVLKEQLPSVPASLWSLDEWALAAWHNHTQTQQTPPENNRPAPCDCTWLYEPPTWQDCRHFMNCFEPESCDLWTSWLFFFLSTGFPWWNEVVSNCLRPNWARWLQSKWNEFAPLISKWVSWGFMGTRLYCCWLRVKYWSRPTAGAAVEWETQQGTSATD